MELKNEIPKYIVIKQDILEKIASGVYVCGDAIPNQQELSQKYNVSRVTVREAVNELKARGILISIKGKGTFVADKIDSYYGTNRLGGLSQNKSQEKGELHSKVLSIEVVPANRGIAQSLKIREGETLIKIHRLRYLDEVCIASEESYLQYQYVNAIDFWNADLEHSSLYSLLREQADIEFKCAEEEIHPVLANDLLAQYFNIEYLTPVLYVKRVTITDDGIPLEYCDNYERGDAAGIRIRTISI
ncbi:GntR family transcriptional regulator [Diplocloster modestus]|uniref:GntR family transcriptional regulator n=1 Tax=Diplocloster modestus TaxID=2850322 RepID=A0ABS6K3C8_9FIRM|nr:GntR family transcriptional regulator [Diplocloster modestus]MBU9725010.1 GntR family transcriptional regulator [Diplocloster modestus]